MTFDPKRRLVMATFKTVLGHGLTAGTPLTVVDEPKARGEIDEPMAERLYGSKLAVYAEDAYATPVETPEQERIRLAASALREAPADDHDVPVSTDDLVVWQDDDVETGKKKGQKVTNDDLRAIAAREGVVIETDDNKADLTRKIVEHRAGAVSANLTNAGSAEAPDMGAGGLVGSTAPEAAGGADSGAVGGTGGSE